MNKDRLIKFLIPVVAVLVIAESVVLVSGALRRDEIVDNIAEEKIAKVLMRLETAEKSMSVGEKLPISLKLSSAESYAVDAIEIYIKYDPSAFEISGLAFNNDLPKPAASRVSREKGMVVVTYLIDEPKGYQLTPGLDLSLVNFEAKAKKAGSFDFEIATSPAATGSVTMLVESIASKVIPFDDSGLTINVL